LVEDMLTLDELHHRGKARVPASSRGGASRTGRRQIARAERTKPLTFKPMLTSADQNPKRSLTASVPFGSA
jgi:hypothetical protein